jgi:hypothetical protein
MKDTMQTVGVWAFIAGIVIALIVGLIAGITGMSNQAIGLWAGIMVLLGLVVGALNVTDKEVNSFIIAAIGMSIGAVALKDMGALLSATQATASMGKMLTVGFSIFGTFVAGAVFIPAVKAVYKLSKD